MQQHADNLIAGGARHAETVSDIGIRAAPPTAYVVGTFAGMTPDQWVTALTLVYLVLSIGHLAWTKMLGPAWRRLRGSRR